MTTQWVNVETIGSFFQSRSHPRDTRNRKHQLIDIVVIAVCGLVCGGITAIPQPLRQLERTDAVITIDALGCQKEIARELVAGGGDFVLAVTDNQPKLRDAIEADFRDHLERNREGLKYRSQETTDQGHGRLDERSYFVTKIPPEFAAKKDWPRVKAIG